MAVFIQHNVGGSANALVSLMETAMERRADIVLVQEPPEYDGNRHPGYEYLWAGRVMTARRKDSDWTVSTEDKYTRAAGGDVQVLALGRRGHQGREIRVVNAYFQGTSRTARERRAHQADWDGILSESSILAGDFNAHSPRWNQLCTQRRDAGFLEGLMDTYELVVRNGPQVTRPNSECYSVIDLTLITPEVVQFCQD